MKQGLHVFSPPHFKIPIYRGIVAKKEFLPSFLPPTLGNAERCPPRGFEKSNTDYKNMQK